MSQKSSRRTKMKKLALLLVAVVLLSAVPVFAQDSFKDVPDDHWAYDAVAKLQDAGLIQGYPGGLFMGKRTLTRYEFAMVIANIYDSLKSMIPKDSSGNVVMPQPVDTSKFITKNDFDNILAAYNAKADGMATKADLNAAVAQMGTDIKNLNAEFRKELDSLNVRMSDLDAKISDLAAMVAMIDAEQKRVKITGTINTAAKVVNSINGTLVDLDGRTANANDNTVRAIGFFTDFDLNIKGKVSENTTVSALLNMGNYLGYLGKVNAYQGGTIARNVGGPGFAEGITPYYMNLETKTSIGDLTVGRFPIQLTPYTLKKIDVDSYVSNAKTDDGNYPIDGMKLATSYGSVDILGYAGKTDNNTWLENGLSTYFATGGLLDQVVDEWGIKDITQTAGIHVGVGIPWDGKLGLTYTRNWSDSAWSNDYNAYSPMFNDPRNQDEIGAANLVLPLPWFEGVSLSANAAVSNIIAEKPLVDKLDWRNGAYDFKLDAPIGPVNLGVGWKRIGENFVAPGNWGKIGRWQNPRMIEGIYGDLGYAINDSLKLNLGGEFYEFTDNKTTSVGNIYKEDKTQRYTGGIEWRMSDANALGVDVEWVSYDWTRVGRFDGDKPTEKYITIGWNHKLNDDAALKVGYQLISYDKGYNGAANNVAWPVPYNNDYNGGLGVVQLGVSF